MSEYFTGLNYSLANEDSWVEYNLAPEAADSILVIAGSGSRAVPLLAKSPALLEIADLSEAQLHLAELRMASIRELSYEEHLFFLGYRGAVLDGTLEAQSRADLFGRLKLSPLCRDYFSGDTAWQKHGVIYLGKWERHFMKLGSLLSRVVRLNAAPLFTAHSIEEQQQLLKKHWNERRFRNFLRLALSEFVFQRFLYGSHFAGSADKRTLRDPAWKMVYREMSRLFNTTLLRKNYFIQMIFLGTLRHEEGLPAEAHPGIFQAAQKALRDGKTRIVYTKQDFIQLTREKAYDFYSLSDAISYVPDAEAETFLARLPESVRSGTRIVLRSFMRQPALDKGSPPSEWKRDSAAAEQARQRDCTGMYEFMVLEKT